MNKTLADYQGYPVRLTEERLRHILDHPEMAILQDKIEETLKYPEQVRASNTDYQVILNPFDYPYKNYCINLVVKGSFICSFKRI